jgi:hypothetical protein
MLCLEFREILLVLDVLSSLLILAQLIVVFLFGGCSLSLASLSDFRREDLPSFAHQFCDFGEREVLAFKFFSDLCLLD